MQHLRKSFTQHVSSNIFMSNLYTLVRNQLPWLCVVK